MPQTVVLMVADLMNLKGNYTNPWRGRDVSMVVRPEGYMELIIERQLVSGYRFLVVAGSDGREFNRTQDWSTAFMNVFCRFLGPGMKRYGGLVGLLA